MSQFDGFWIDGTTPLDDVNLTGAMDAVYSAASGLVAANMSGGTAGVQSITAGTNVTLGGTATNPVINASGGGGGSFTFASYVAAVQAAGVAVDTPELHGAVRNGTTDDTAAINAAVSSVVAAGQANGSNYGEVWFTPGTYAINGSVITGGTTFGRAQIPLPNISMTAQKFTLVFKSVTNASGADAPAIWTQTSAQTTGAVVLKSNLNTSFDSGLGTASVIGGPTSQQQSGNTYSNLLFVADGIRIVGASTHAWAAMDLRRVACIRLGCVGVQGSDFDPASPSVPNWSGTSYGIMTPSVGNNDLNTIQSYTAEFVSVGLCPSEHVNIASLRTIFCGAGILPLDNGNDLQHITYWSSEECTYHMNLTNVTNSGSRFHITSWDIEDATELVAHVADPNAQLRGIAYYTRNKPATGLNQPLVTTGTTTTFVAVNLSAPAGNQL